RWLGSARPQHRYLLMLAGLLAMAVAPALTAGRLAMSGESLSPSPSAAVQQLEFLEPTGSEALSVDPFSLRPQDAAEAPVELSGLGSAPHRWMPWLLCGWLTGVFLLSGRLIFGAVIVARLRQGSRPLPASLGVAVRRMRSQLRLGH